MKRSINNQGKRAPIRFLVLLLAALLWICQTSALAGETEETDSESETTPHFELDEMVVTGTRVADEVRDLPKNVTVITSEDIAQSPSQNVVDLLAREADINLRSFYGHDKFGGVDLRGMGDTFVSNVLVLVDGFRRNPSDMAGPDLSSIPLEQIERIEIVRGAGSVIYGDGAVGGVINIITKTGKSKPALKLQTSYGGYETLDSSFNYGGRVGSYNFNVTGGYHNTRGYRVNSYYRHKDLSMSGGYDRDDKLSVSFTVGSHKDTYGMPGPVSKENMDDREMRTKTNAPQDGGNTEDDRVQGTLRLYSGNWGELTLQSGFRHRQNDYILGYTKLLSKARQTNYIDEKSTTINLGYLKEYGSGEKKHRFQAGVDYQNSDYVRTVQTNKLRNNSDIDKFGAFLYNRWALTDSLFLDAGFRHGWVKGRFRDDVLKTSGGSRYWVDGEPYQIKWKNDSHEAGLVWRGFPSVEIFLNYATSFRTPNVDELALADNDLHPQKAKNLEMGIRAQIGQKAEVTLTGFKMTAQDEIYYGEDPSTGFSVNRNYDQKTIRQGVEADVKVYPIDNLYLWANASYMDARFEESGCFIPLVPRLKASAGFDWAIVRPLTLSVSGTYVGKRYDGNDLNNDLYEPLEPYSVYDAKLTYQRENMKVYFGVKNLTDELYSTISYSETYYPMPTRTYFTGIEWTF